MSRKIIDFVERNIHGAWVVWGDLGIRQYYGYTKKRWLNVSGRRTTSQKNGLWKA